MSLITGQPHTWTEDLGKGTPQKDYYGSLFAVFGAGPAYALAGWKNDGKIVWKPSSPVLQSASSNPYTFDVEGYGRVHWYWGLDNDSWTDPVMSGRDVHPHRGKVKAVLEDYLFGRERQTPPDIMPIWWRQPQQSVITGNAALLDAQGQANPLCMLAEYVTSKLNGRGLDASIIDATTWQVLADALYTNRTREYLTFDLFTAIDLRSMFTRVNTALDTWFRMNSAGKIEVGRFLQGTENPTGLVTINEDNIADTSQVDIKPQSSDELKTRVNLVFKNRAKNFEDDIAPYEDVLNTVEIQQDEPEEIQMPSVRRATQANAKATEKGTTLAKPYDVIKYQGKSRDHRNLNPGDNYIFSFGGGAYTRIVRMIEKEGEQDGGGPVKITAETERNLAPLPYEPPEYSLPTEALVEPEDVDYWHVIQLPVQLTGNRTYRLAALVGQDIGQLRGFTLWFKDQSTDYLSLGSHTSFAYPVTLADDYSMSEDVDDTSGNLLVYKMSPEPLGFSNLGTAPTEDEISNDHLLLIVIKASDPKLFEIMTVQSIESPTAGEYPIHVLRARFGTLRLDFSEDDPAYFIYRHKLAFFTHNRLAGMAAESLLADRTATFKISPFTAFNDLDLSDATAGTLELKTQQQIIDNPVITDPDTTSTVPVPSVSPPAQTFASSLNVDASVSSGIIYYTTNGQKPGLTSSQWSSTVNITETTQFRFRNYLSGKWSEEVVITYSKTTAPSSQQVATPTHYFEGIQGYGGSLSMSCATSGSTIYYKLIDYPPSSVPTMDADGANTGGWSTYSTPVSIPVGNKFVWIYGYKSGLVNSGPTGFSSFAG